jgi:CRP-like cAMP-binding protein
MAGLPVFLSDGLSSVRAVTQIPGSAYRLPAAELRRIAPAGSALHDLLMRYTQAVLSQVAQTAACNSSHMVEQRCARWLLMTHDRVDGDEFPLTHEFLSHMLGVRRSGVTVAMRALKEAGLVRYTRGRVIVADRAGLERASCECYRVVRSHFERLLPRSA